jgi:hypothetical protein
MMNLLKTRRRAFQPALDGLETRSLLSAMGMMHQGARAHHNTMSLISELAAASPTTVSTVPANGDINPYGVAYVPSGFARGGPLRPGMVLVSNFNAKSNFQGTGTTIVAVSSSGSQNLFFQGPSGLGLTAALGVLKSGFVVVGSMPTTDGTAATIQPGSLLVLNRQGQVVVTVANTSAINGPWGLAVNDRGNHPQVFVSNVLNGTVERLDFQVTHRGQQIALTGETQIASGYMWRADPAALELGPTGLAFNSRNNTLYVASTLDGAIYAIPNASTTTNGSGTGQVVTNDSTHLHGPLGMLLAPNGDLIVANGDALNTDSNQPSEIVEFTPSGQFVGQFSIDTGTGGPFGIGDGIFRRNVAFAAVDDLNNTVQLRSVLK